MEIIYAKTVREIGIDPAKPFVMPPTPQFSLFGHKMRRRLAKETNLVLFRAGLAQHNGVTP